MRDLFKKAQKLNEITDLPQSSIGAPLPFVLASEGQLAVLYYIQQHDPDWDGTTVRIVGLDSKTEQVAAVRFKRPYAHTLGPPNDEAIEGHPLSSLGLKPYACFEVRQSAWIRELCRRNAVHPNHSDSLFADYRHFILSFHDSTFEVVAEGFACEMLGEMSVLDAATKLLLDWQE